MDLSALIQSLSHTWYLTPHLLLKAIPCSLLLKGQERVVIYKLLALLYFVNKCYDHIESVTLPMQDGTKKSITSLFRYTVYVVDT